MAKMASGKIACLMVEDNCFILMVAITQAILKMEFQTEKADLSAMTVGIMKVNLKISRLKVKGSLYSKNMVLNFKVIGLLTFQMGTEDKPGEEIIK